MSSSQQQPVLLSWPSSDDFAEDDATESDYYTSSVTEDVAEDEQKEPARSTSSGKDKRGPRLRDRRRSRMLCCFCSTKASMRRAEGPTKEDASTLVVPPAERDVVANVRKQDHARSRPQILPSNQEPHMPPRSTARTLTPSRSTDFTITHDLEFDYASSTATSVGKTWSSGVASSSKNLRGTMTPSFLDDDATPRNKDD